MQSEEWLRLVSGLLPASPLPLGRAGSVFPTGQWVTWLGLGVSPAEALLPAARDQSQAVHGPPSCPGIQVWCLFWLLPGEDTHQHLLRPQGTPLPHQMETRLRMGERQAPGASRSSLSWAHAHRAHPLPPPSAGISAPFHEWTRPWAECWWTTLSLVGPGALSEQLQPACQGLIFFFFFIFS